MSDNFGENQTDKINSRQRRALTALVATGSVSEAAAAASVVRDTVYRWLKEPAFIAAYQAAESEALDLLAARLTALGDSAASTLAGVLENESAAPGVRVRAAEAVLSNLLKVRELAGLEARISELERLLAERGVHDGE